MAEADDVARVERTASMAPAHASRTRLTGLILTGVSFAMLGMAYAAVPLYRIFCQATGYGGTTQTALAAPDQPLAEAITIRFDANIAPGLAWHFRPVQRQLDLKIGEQGLAFFEARNDALHAVTGTATFNVTPEIAGSYFSKIQCFCFTEQTLQPGERADMPVSFFVDPAIRTDPDTRNIKEITLSYTFFAAADQKTAARAGAEGKADGS